MAVYSARFPLMGGAGLLQFADDRGRAAAEALVRAAQREARRIEERFSRFLPRSLVARINAAAGRRPVPVDAEALVLLAAGRELTALTGGRFDVTIGALWCAWDRVRERVPAPAEIDVLLPLVDGSAVELTQRSVFLPRPGMAIDLGGLAKEHAADRVAALLAGAGIRSGLVNFGGDVRAVGAREDGSAWCLGVTDPRAPDRSRLALRIPDGAGVATSGTYARGFTRAGVRYHDLLDARTALPARTGVSSATAIAGDTLRAGRFATAALLLGAAEGLALLERTPGVEGVIVTDDDAVLATAGVPAA